MRNLFNILSRVLLANPFAKRISLVVSLIILFTSQLFGQATSVSVSTTSTTDLSASYYTWTTVDPNLSITANGNITGFRVQISQTYTSGDQLTYTGTLPTGVTAAFNTTTGVLVFTGSTTAANWQTLLRTVQFRSTSTTCYANLRRITFVAGTVFYNPLTEHFYEYVVGSTTWTNAKSVSETRSYFGRAGYLATMSSEAENNFVWKLMSSDAWFGASDEMNIVNTAKGTTAFASQAAVEQKWHWVSGPEKGTQFSNGATAVTGQYSKWASGEPNNSGGEHYGQFYSSNAGQWNDLQNSTLPGYIAEYGDMPGDQTTSITISTRNVQVGSSSSGYISGGDINVCSGSNTTTLTLNGLTGSVVRWESSFDNFFTAGTSITSTSSSITVSNLTKTTYYRAIVNSTSPTTCTNLATSSVYLAVKPTKSGTVFADNSAICAGGNVTLTLAGQQGNVNKWQRSTNLSTWTDIANTTISLVETLSTAGTYYYRVEVQTPNCGSAVISDNRTITVTSGTPPVGGSVSSAAHATATNSGTLTLSGYTGTIVKWQRSVNEGVTWTDLVNTAATYSYTNQIDGTLFRAQLTSGTCGNAFSQAGTITVAPFTYSGFVYNTEGSGITGVKVKLYSKLKAATLYTQLDSTNTISTGKYTFSTVLSPNKYDFRLEIGTVIVSDPAQSDAQFFNQKIFTSDFAAKDYYRMDVNGNGVLSVTDVYLIFAKIIGVTDWYPTVPEYRIFTAAQWSAINASTLNLTVSYPGVQSISINSLVSNSSSNFYLVKTGFKQ